MDARKPKESFFDRLSVFLATGLFVSYVPSALLNALKNKSETRHTTGGQAHILIEKKWTGAGLLGSIEGALMYLFLPARIAFSGMAVLIGLAVAVYFSGRAEKILNSHDDSRIVIDEWIGAWIAVWGLQQKLTGIFIIAFVLFRLFDVLKGPIGRACQRLPGGWGVTFDDVYAGVFANICWRVGMKTLMHALSH